MANLHSGKIYQVFYGFPEAIQKSSVTPSGADFQSRVPNTFEISHFLFIVFLLFVSIHACMCVCVCDPMLQMYKISMQ